MPRSFLVKKKSPVLGMPRPVSVEAAYREEAALYPATAAHISRSPLSGLPCTNIFSPAKLYASSTPASPVSIPQTPERCLSRCSSGSTCSTPEPINYSMSSYSPRYNTENTSPAVSPEPAHYAPASSPTAADLSHLPFLALSFKRLQEMHMKAVESRLQGITMSPPRGAAPVSPPPHSPTSASGIYSPVCSPPLPVVSSPSPAHCHGYPAMSPVSASRSPVSPISRSPVSPISRSPVSPVSRSPVSESRGDLSMSPVLPPHGGLQNYHQHYHQYQHRETLPVAAAPPTSYSWTTSTTAKPNSVPMDISEAMVTPKKNKNDPPRYQCEACNKSYATFSGLSKHKQFHCTALIKKEFTCKHCDKKYVSLGALKMHIRTHTLPCKCHICGKAFSRPWLLQGHVRTHTGEKPFPCNHCGRSFADRSNLRAHLQTHTDIKKYNCRNCSKSFSRSSLLHKHMDNGCGSSSAGLVRSL